MRVIRHIFLYVLCLLATGNALAQQAKPLDYDLITQRNAWLSATNAAALTTYADSNVVKGGIRFSHDKGQECTVSSADGVTSWGADVESYYRLSRNIVAFGAISYGSTSRKAASGSAFVEGEDIKPFDIIIPTTGDAAGERIDITGALGWNVWQNLSLGARIDYTTANHSRQKDLRYANTLMNLNTMVSAYYDLRVLAIGASFLYRRTTEDLVFKTFGTTDIVHSSLIDYANGMGITETFNGNGFTNSNEQPLFSDYFGAAMQLSVPIASRFTAFADLSYARRKGHYGTESQFTIVHARHESDCYGIRGRLQYTADKSMHWLEVRTNIENLTAWRTNYIDQNNDGVPSYRYYDPVKTANKVRAYGAVAYTAHITPRGRNMYLWTVNAGALFDQRKQTAYLFPDKRTEDYTLWTPYIDVTRRFVMKNTSMLTAEVGVATQTCSGDRIENYDLMTRNRVAGTFKVGYEFPVKQVKGLRPNVAVSYKTLHKNIACSVGILF